jgi:hypothetical protein
VFPSMTKGEIVGRLVVVIDVNPSHWILDPTVDRSR